LIHCTTAEREVPLEKRLPSSQEAPSARLCRFTELEPMPLLAEVQKGTIFDPFRLVLSRHRAARQIHCLAAPLF